MRIERVKADQPARRIRHHVNAHVARIGQPVRGLLEKLADLLGTA